MNARPFSRPRHSLFLLLAILLLLVVGVPAAQAAVTTDQLDYAPGSVVTFLGTPDDSLPGWAPGAMVTVVTVGPLGISYPSAPTYIGMDGSWSCQFTLDEDPVFAVGEYTYTASADDSSATQVGSFTDAVNTRLIEVTSTTPATYGGTVTLSARLQYEAGSGNSKYWADAPADKMVSFTLDGDSVGSGTTTSTSSGVASVEVTLDASLTPGNTYVIGASFAVETGPDGWQKCDGTGSLAVEGRTIIVVAVDKTITYGEADPELTFTIAGDGFLEA